MELNYMKIEWKAVDNISVTSDKVLQLSQEARKGIGVTNFFELCTAAGRYTLNTGYLSEFVAKGHSSKYLKTLMANAWCECSCV